MSRDLGVQMDHVAVDARDLEGSAEFLAHVLGLGAPTPEGEDGDMLRIDLDHGAFLLFAPSEDPRPSHLAFRVAPDRFAEVLSRLRARGVAFGNEPHETDNGRTEDPLGGEGRVYFHDDNGHLWEVTCP